MLFNKNAVVNRLVNSVHLKEVVSPAGVGVLGGLLYAAGGHDGPLVRKSVEVFDPQSNTWRLVCDMNMCRRNAGELLSHFSTTSCDVFIDPRLVPQACAPLTDSCTWSEETTAPATSPLWSSIIPPQISGASFPPTWATAAATQVSQTSRHRQEPCSHIYPPAPPPAGVAVIDKPLWPGAPPASTLQTSDWSSTSPDRSCSSNFGDFDVTS